MMPASLSPRALVEKRFNFPIATFMTENRLKTAADLEDAFLKWNELLYKYAFVRLRNRELAQDITQDVFAKAWQHRETFDPGKSSLKNWLFAIMINSIRDHFRSQKNQPCEELEEDLVADINISDEVEQKTLMEFVFKQIKTLPQRDQEILFLRYTDDLPVQEIASILKMSYTAAKVCLHRALQKLRVKCNPPK